MEPAVVDREAAPDKVKVAPETPAVPEIVYVFVVGVGELVVVLKTTSTQ